MSTRAGSSEIKSGIQRLTFPFYHTVSLLVEPLQNLSENPREALKVLQNWKYRLGSTTPIGVLATIPVLVALQEIQETKEKDDLKVILMASGALTQVCIVQLYTMYT